MCTGAIRSALAVSDALALLLHRLSAAAQMAAYGGFYTRQEQEDAMAARIENPNRVGSGFVNYGAQERQLQPATNWQTGNLVGGASVGNTPAQVSDIWNSQSAAPPQQRMQAGQQMQQQQMQQQLAQQNYGAAPPQQAVANMGALFQSLGIDNQANPHAYPGAAGVSAQYMNGMNNVNVAAMSAAAVQPQQAQSLMSLLQNPAASAQMNAAFAGHGAVPQAGRNPVPHRQMQQNGAPARHVPQPPNAGMRPAGRPANLVSAADYAAAAQSYKPPAPSRPSAAATSVARKPEASRQTVNQTASLDWECPRCTFLNNSALRECEMCGFERPGKEPSASAPGSGSAPARGDDDGWRTASSSSRKSAPVQNAMLAGKSKTQAKNEKRRAKKRLDGN